MGCSSSKASGDVAKPGSALFKVPDEEQALLPASKPAEPPAPLPAPDEEQALLPVTKPAEPPALAPARDEEQALLPVTKPAEPPALAPVVMEPPPAPIPAPLVVKEVKQTPVPCTVEKEEVSTESTAPCLVPSPQATPRPAKAPCTRSPLGLWLTVFVAVAAGVGGAVLLVQGATVDGGPDETVLKHNDCVFLSLDGDGADNQPGSANSPWRRRALGQDLFIEKQYGVAEEGICSGDSLFLRTPTGRYVALGNKSLVTDVEVAGPASALVIKKPRSGGLVRAGDSIVLLARNGKFLLVSDGEVRASAERPESASTFSVRRQGARPERSGAEELDEGRSKAVLDIETEPQEGQAQATQPPTGPPSRPSTSPPQATVPGKPLIRAGEKIFLRTKWGTTVTVQDAGLHCKWSHHGLWQALELKPHRHKGGAINSGDAVFLQTSYGKHVTILGERVKPQRRNLHEVQQLFIIEKEDGGGPITEGDAVTFRTHEHKYLMVEGQDVRAGTAEDKEKLQFFVETDKPGAFDGHWTRKSTPGRDIFAIKGDTIHLVDNIETQITEEVGPGGRMVLRTALRGNGSHHKARLVKGQLHWSNGDVWVPVEGPFDGCYMDQRQPELGEFQIRGHELSMGNGSMSLTNFTAAGFATVDPEAPDSSAELVGLDIHWGNGDVWTPRPGGEFDGRWTGNENPGGDFFDIYGDMLFWDEPVECRIKPSGSHGFAIVHGSPPWERATLKDGKLYWHHGPIWVLWNSPEPARATTTTVAMKELTVLANESEQAAADALNESSSGDELLIEYAVADPLPGASLGRSLHLAGTGVAIVVCCLLALLWRRRVPRRGALLSELQRSALEP